MTAVAALEVWQERNLRVQLLRIANSGTSGAPEEFYGRAWSLITRLRAGRSPEYYLARVIAECCRPGWARRGPVGLRWQAPIEVHCISDEEPPSAKPLVLKNELDD